MINAIGGTKLFAGFRGYPPLNHDELVGCLLTLSRFMIDHHEISEIDINPIRVTAAGLVALDALFVLEKR
jgi:acetyltransferase